LKYKRTLSRKGRWKIIFDNAKIIARKTYKDYDKAIVRFKDLCKRFERKYLWKTLIAGLKIQESIAAGICSL